MILFYAEHNNGRLTDSAYGLTGVGREIADKARLELAAVLIGPGTRSFVSALGEHGVDKVFICEDERLAGYAPEAAVHFLASLIDEKSPLAVLFAETSTSADLAVRLAARLRMGLASRSISIALDGEGDLRITRLGYADQLQTSVTGAQIIIWKSGIGEVKRAPRSPKVDERGLDDSPDAVRVKVIEIIKADPKTIPLRQAEFIVSGGNGVRNFELLWKLADRLRASVGGSRVVCDDGRLERGRQIGESGITVKPRCYLAFGISGASQHLRGMQESKLIIAVNTDRFAPLMKMANMAVVADAEAVIEAMLSRLGESVM
ncbi:MAG: electron transfer flavoprotein subunit alpha/FixB family protein [Gammaproteobacteria bacterium]|nr:electron transfer flavoprotein subunit alpha/FixB family protein [Gammaproteobacteria bacterium]